MRVNFNSKMLIVQILEEIGFKEIELFPAYFINKQGVVLSLRNTSATNLKAVFNKSYTNPLYEYKENQYYYLVDWRGKQVVVNKDRLVELAFGERSDIK